VIAPEPAAGDDEGRPGRVSAFADLDAIGVQTIWDGVVGRSVHGERATLALVELEPGASVPSHEHDNEQLGLLVQGSLTFSIGAETRELAPGATWCIPSHAHHSVLAGPDGAVIVELFAPARHDWHALETRAPAPGRWP
jgi:quercetin dioxygenase-like cupin family protein